MRKKYGNYSGLLSFTLAFILIMQMIMPTVQVFADEPVQEEVGVNQEPEGNDDNNQEEYVPGPSDWLQGEDDLKGKLPVDEEGNPVEMEEREDDFKPSDWVEQEKEVQNELPVDEDGRPVEMQYFYGDEEPEVYEGRDLGNIVDSASVEYNGKEIGKGETVTVKDGDELTVKYKWKYDDEIRDGDTSIINIPEGIIPLKKLIDEPIDMVSDVYGVVGRFIIRDNNTIEVLFNDKLENKVDKEGEILFKYGIKANDFWDNSIKNIEFEDELGPSFTIKFDSGKGVDIAKKGTARKENRVTNPTNIAWEITINTKLENLTNVVVDDILPEGLELVGDIDVIELVVGAHKVTEKGVVKKENKFPINMGNIDKAYRIKFDTKIVDKSKTEFENKATITSNENGEKSADAKVEYKKDVAFSKSGVFLQNDSEIEWTVEVNKNEEYFESLKLVDNLDEYQELIEDSIRIDGKTIEESGFKLEKADERNFTIDFGKVDESSPKKKFTVKYRTKVHFDKENHKPGAAYQIKNKVNLILEGSSSEEKEAVVWAYRNKLLEKWGNKGSDPDGKDYIEWTITLDRGHEELVNPVIKDKLPNSVGNPELINIIYESGGKVDESDYNFSTDKDGNLIIEFKITVKEVIIIRYKTYITDYNEEYFVNQALIGENEDGASSVLPGYKPTITKTNGEVDYNRESVAWTVEVNSLSGDFTKFVLEDHMSDNHDLIPNSVSVYVNSIAPENKLDRNEDYMEIDHSETMDKFAIVISPNQLKGVKKVIIQYRSTFKIHPDDEETTTISNNLVNKAIAHIETEGRKEETLEAEKIVPIKGWVSGNGGKLGFFDKEAKKIHWNAYLNPLATDYDEEVITDQMSEGQEVDYDSIKIYSYEFDEQGNPVVKEFIPEFEEGSSEYDRNYRIIKYENKTKFGIQMMDLYGPIMIKYDSLIIGKTHEKYTNVISLDEDNYDAEVIHKDYDNFIEKSSSSIEGDVVYKGDILEWEISLNDSYSDLENVKLVDVISVGHRYMKNSLKIYDNYGKEVELSSDKITLEPEDNDKVDQTLTIDFGNIGKGYKVKYRTLVVGEKGTIENNAKLLAEGEDPKSTGILKYDVEVAASGTGSGHEGRGNLKIKKVDETGKQIGEAKFKLVRIYEDMEISIGVFETVNGEINIEGLQPGHYMIKEIEAPEGYHLMEEEVEIEIEAGVNQVSIENKKVNNVITVKKHDKDDKNKLLKGAIFDILNDKKLPILRGLETDENGEIVIRSLDVGTYYLKEMMSPVDYEIDLKLIEFKIEEDNTVKTIEVGNKKMDDDLGNLEIIKIEKNNPENRLEGVKFKVTGPHSYNKDFTTNENGSIKLTGLAKGEYSIEEIAAPKGYVKTDEVKKVTIDNARVRNIVVFENAKDKPFVSGIEIIKVDENNIDKRLKGAEFVVLNAEGQVIRTVTTDDNGSFIINNLEQGTYRIKETKAPEGYIKTDKVETVTLSDDKMKKVVAFKNIKESDHSLEIIKVDKADTNKRLEGAEFIISDENGNDIKIVVTDKNGLAEVSGLKTGKYKVRESRAPFRYLLSKEVKEIVIDDARDKKVVAFENEKDKDIKTELDIIKVDSQDKLTRLEGAEFIVLDSEGKEVGRGTTNSDGFLEFKNLPEGKYTVKEVKAPKGYINTDKTKEVTIDMSKTKAVVGFENDKETKSSLELIKVDKNNPNKRLADAEFAILDKDGKLVKNVKTDETGMVLVEDLEHGKYIIKEIKAPKGYRIISETQSIVLDDSKIKNIVVFENEEEVKPGRPGKPRPKPERPKDPTDPKDPEDKPGEPEDPKDKPGKPTDPEEPEENLDKPLKPGDPGYEEWIDGAKKPGRDPSNGQGGSINNIDSSMHDNKVDGSPMTDKYGNILPQTGEIRNYNYIIIGLGFLVLGLLLLKKKKKQ